MKKLSINEEHIASLLRETIEMMCEKGLHFKCELKIEGMIGITIDSLDCFFVHINKTYNIKEEPICTSTDHGEQIKDGMPQLQRVLDVDNIQPISEVNLDDFPDIEHENGSAVEEIPITTEANNQHYQEMTQQQNYNYIPEDTKFQMQMQIQDILNKQQYQQQLKRKQDGNDGNPMPKQARMTAPQKNISRNINQQMNIQNMHQFSQQQQQQELSYQNTQQMYKPNVQQFSKQQQQPQHQQMMQQHQMRSPMQPIKSPARMQSPLRMQGQGVSPRPRMKAIGAPPSPQQMNASAQQQFNTIQGVKTNLFNNMDMRMPNRMINPSGTRLRGPPSTPPRPIMPMRNAKSTVVEGVSRKGFPYKREMTVVTTYSCNFCGNNYKHQKSLARHQDQMHNKSNANSGNTSQSQFVEDDYDEEYDE